MTASMPAVLEYPFPAPPAPGATIEVAPRIHWLRMPLPFALDHINLWLLADDDGFTLVDCGYGDGPTRALWEQHFATLLAARPLARIVATHCHPDHVGNAAWLSARTGAPVAMTHAEFLTAHALAGQHGGYGAAPTIALFRKHGMAPEHIAAFDARGNPYRRGVPELPATFDRLLDGDTRTLGGTAWTVVEGHGHSPEHASLFSRERGVLISGDMLLPKISTNVSVWAPEPDGDPLRAFPRLDRRVRDAAARHAGAAVARSAVPRNSGTRRAAARTPRRAPVRARRRGRRGACARQRRRRRPRAVSPRARSAAALLRDGRGDRPPEPPLARRTRRPRRRRRRRDSLRVLRAR